MKIKSIVLALAAVTVIWACNEDIGQDSLPRLEDESVIQGLVSGAGTYVDLSQTLLETGASNVNIKTYPTKGVANFVEGKWLKYAASSDFSTGSDLLELSFSDADHNELKVVRYSFQMNLDSADFHCMMGAIGDVYCMPYDTTLTEYILANDIFCSDSVSDVSLEIIADPQFGSAYIDSENILIYEFDLTNDFVSHDSLVYSLELTDLEGNKYLSAADVVINFFHSGSFPDSIDTNPDSSWVEPDSVVVDPDSIPVIAIQLLLMEDSLFINTDSAQVGDSYYLDVYSNDVLIDADMSTLEFSQPPNGTVHVENSVNLYYTPNDGFTGLDDFSYSVCPTVSNENCPETYVHVTVF